MRQLTDLFLTCNKIGAFTLGGGYAMIPILEREFVTKKKWLTKEEFLDMMIVSQSMPGIFACHMGSHIGYKIGGVRGGIIGALGIILPSMIAILLIAIFFGAFKDNIYVEKFFKGVRPAVVALIAGPCFTMAKTAKLTWHTAWIPVISCVLIALMGVSPIWIILVAGLSGYLYGKYTRKKGEKTN